ncbi:hypothetical protein H5410_064839 [Solanum commersonii]|uniref:Uncharacterized protein n=1 Tax=Solanum commersonii TaxID=4109 RepID=A0A9J5VYE4_SOLCO|nr:hypothetical protein H5410_064839 [Solanum commersonii]
MVERFEINLDEHYVKDSMRIFQKKNEVSTWRYKLKQFAELTPENWNRLCGCGSIQNISENEHEKVEPDESSSTSILITRASMTTDEIVDTVTWYKARKTQHFGYKTSQPQIQDQQSQIEALNSQLNTIVARQEEMFRKMRCFVSAIAF